MSFPVPTSHAASLALTIDAIRRETDAMVAAGTLSVSADDLIGGPGDVRTWLLDLTMAIVAADEDEVALPSRDPGDLQPVVYSLSAILVWAAELFAEGRSAVLIPIDALAAWEVVESLAGLTGRTAHAIGLHPGAIASGCHAGDADDVFSSLTSAA